MALIELDWFLHSAPRTASPRCLQGNGGGGGNSVNPRILFDNIREVTGHNLGTRHQQQANGSQTLSALMYYQSMCCQS